jgi:hypothetical protein
VFCGGGGYWRNKRLCYRSYFSEVMVVICSVFVIIIAFILFVLIVSKNKRSFRIMLTDEFSVPYFDR